MKRILSISGLCAIALFVTGCGNQGKVEDVQRVKATGKITFNGKPLESGTITFDAKNGQAPGSCNILDGKYDGLVPVGKCHVVITSFKKINLKEKMKMDGPGYDTPVDENILPARYSTESKIEKEVTPQGPNEFNFELTN